MHDHIHTEGSRAFPIDWLVTPGLAFSHPTEVLDHPEFSHAERRAILASWASDAHAVEGAVDSTFPGGEIRRGQRAPEG